MIKMGFENGMREGIKEKALQNVRLPRILLCKMVTIKLA